jgi:membrane protein required for colicin V production
MTALDIIVLILVGGGLVFGFLRGFVTEILSLLAWVAAIVALKLGHEPATAALAGVGSGAAVLAFVLLFGVVFILGKLIARRVGSATRRSVVGPVDRVLGGGFGALKGLIGATLLYLGASLIYDYFNTSRSPRPEWMTASRSYPLLHVSGRAIVDFVDSQRSPEDEA